MGIFFFVLPNMVHNFENGREFATKKNSIYRLYSTNWAMRVKSPPYVILGGPFSRKGIQERSPPKGTVGTDCSMRKQVGLAGRFADILEHSGH